jgi:hypothetical protein
LEAAIEPGVSYHATTKPERLLEIPMELRHIRYFLAVAEERNFTRAAEKLGIGQPPVSQQIRDLEGELGAALFHRVPHGAELTEAGEAFLIEARSILAGVPSYNSVRLDDRKRTTGLREQPVKTNKNHAIHSTEGQSLRQLPSLDVKLVTKHQDLSLQRGPRPEQ